MQLGLVSLLLIVSSVGETICSLLAEMTKFIAVINEISLKYSNNTISTAINLTRMSNKCTKYGYRKRLKWVTFLR